MNEIGEKLKEARQAKGYTLDDLQQMTKIQKRYLIAVEEGNHEVLPGNFYARAFIKQYADSVGLNGEELIDTHMDSLPQVNETTYSKGVESTQTRSKANSSGFLATIQDSLPTILIVLLVIAIIFAIYIAVTNGGANGDEESFIQGNDSSEILEVDTNEDLDEEDADNSDSDTDENQDAEEEVVEEEETEEIEETEQVVEEAGGTANSTSYDISGTHPEEQSIFISAENGSTWVSIEIDGELVNQATLTDGQTLEAEFNNEVSNIELVLGNSPAASVELNGESLSFSEEARDAVRKVMNITFE